MRVNFEEVSIKVTRRWTDENGKKRQQTRKFFQTINPFNTGADDLPKRLLPDHERAAGREGGVAGGRCEVSENQKRLLQQALDMLEEQALHIEAPMLPAGEELLKRIRAAISQQAEPAPAQDEREAFEAWMVEVEGARIRPRFDRVTAGPFADEYRDGRIQGAWNVWQARAARPAQTEQQPVAVVRENNHCPEGLSDEISEYLPHGTKLYAAPIAQTALQRGGWISVEDRGCLRAATLSAVTAERDRLRDQVKALQSDANSWQSGYDKGRNDGTKHRQSEVAQLRAEAEVEASGWIPLTKAMPPDGVPVLRWPGWAAEFSIDEWCNDYGCFLMSIEGGERATHWKPLCAPKAAMAAKEVV